MKLIPVLLALLGAGAPDAGDDGPLRVDDFACLDQTGTFHRLSRKADLPFVVLWTFAADCPVVREQGPALAELARELGERVRFLGLDVAPGDTRGGVSATLADVGLDLPVLMDRTQCSAEMLEATGTAEAIVIATGDWTVRWRGPVLGPPDDDGARRVCLREALTAVLAGGEPPADTPPAAGTPFTFVAPREGHEVTFVRDVAPILERRCVSCHRDGGIGPWAMTNHQKLVGWSAMVREALMTRRMPPWWADPEHGSFVEDIGMTPDEVRTIVHWAETGMERGEGPDPLEQEAPPEPEWPLGEPDLVITLPEQHIPATGRIPYHHEDVKLDLPEGRWVRALDLRPSNGIVLHHAFAFVRGKQEIRTLVEEVDEFPKVVREQALAWLAEQGDDPDPDELPPGALDFLKRRAFLGRTYFARYFPGTRSAEQNEGGTRHLQDEFPAGTGKWLPENPELYFELHYTTYGVATTDTPSLGIYFHDEPPPSELRVTSAFTRKILIEPHQREYRLTVEKVFDEDVTIYALSPHMHYRGRSMRYTAVLPDGSEEVLLSVAEYVFDWQAHYTLQQPRDLPAGTRIVCEAVYDNSRWNEDNPDPNQRVRFGPRTEDEMFVAYIVYAVR